MRHWTSAYVDSQAAGSQVRNKFDVALLPSGKSGSVGTFGGWGLAVSRFSSHPREALELVRYLTRKDLQVKRARVLFGATTLPELYDLPSYVTQSSFRLLSQAFRTGIVLRPSNVSGKKYQDVSEAYFQAVHSVLAARRVRHKLPQPWRMNWFAQRVFKRDRLPYGIRTPPHALEQKL